MATAQRRSDSQAIPANLEPRTVILDRLDKADKPAKDARPYYIPAQLINPNFPRPLPPVPNSPYEDPSKICVARNGEVVEVEGFPSSPFRIQGSTLEPFRQALFIPPVATPINSVCNDAGYCLDAYEINAVQFEANLGCPAVFSNGSTTLVGYNGTVPGPTIVAPRGRHSLVRFKNFLTAGQSGPAPMTLLPPCGENGRGDPAFGLTVHQHGGANLAPYDGWADDFICGNQFKDYVWPNAFPKTLWYHDHHLDHTTESVYNGLRALYIISDKTSLGGCGEPWGLESMEDLQLVFTDSVFNRQCDLFYDRGGIHKNNLYGDVNFVNGVPWPTHAVRPEWYRMRLLGGANVRPFQLRLVNQSGVDVSSQICWVVAADGGFRRFPVRFPPEGIWLAPAFRWEVVCDFSRVPGQQLILWNELNPFRHKGTPYFCYTHLTMRFDVGACPSGTRPDGACVQTPFFDPTNPPLVETQTDDVIGPAERAAALELLRQQKADRQIIFNRNGGHWAMNNVVWNDSVIIYDDISQNGWELWDMQNGGGGWYHPVHVHLVEFEVLARNWEPRQLRNYEGNVSRDMAHLDPGYSKQVLARFGPHLGAWMFHCHNSVHEDFQMMRAFNIVDYRVGKRGPVRTMFDPNVWIFANGIYDMYANPTAPAAEARNLSEATPLTNSSYLLETLNTGLYAIFYPTAASLPTVNATILAALSNETFNRWFVVCPDGREPWRQTVPGAAASGGGRRRGLLQSHGHAGTTPRRLRMMMRSEWLASMGLQQR